MKTWEDSLPMQRQMMQDRGILKGQATDTEEETERIKGGDNTEMTTWTLFSK